jgi:hypothetical protein
MIRACNHPESNPASYCKECHPAHHASVRTEESDRIVLTPEQFDRFKRTGDFDMSRFDISEPMEE